MDLNDLLVSYKVVDVPKRTIPSIPTISTIEYFTHDMPAVESKTSMNEVIETPTTNYYISSITAPGFKKTKLSNKWENPYKKNKNKWVEDLTRAYTKAGIKNDNALKMLISQDALESRWGRSAQGKFNFGNLTTGAKWKGDYITGNDKNAKGEAIKQKFRSYNSIDEYAADKLQFLKRLYDFDENDNIDKFVAKLTGSNRGKRKYAEATNYASSLKGVFNSFKKGGVIKALTGTIIPDNTRVVKPTILEKITRTYWIPELPLFVLDSRSDWERLLSWDKALAAYNQYTEDKEVEEGLRNLNGFLTFTDYATIGLGAGSLLTKGLKRIGKKAIELASRLKIKDVTNSLHLAKIGDILQQNGIFPHREYKLPDYAKPHSQSIKAVDYHLARIEKGFENIPKVDSKGIKVVNRIPYRNNNFKVDYMDIDEDPEKYITNLYNFFKERYSTYPDELIREAVKDAIKRNPAFAPASSGKVFINKRQLSKMYGVDNIPGVISHEIDHAIHIPTKSAEGFDMEYLRKSIPSDPNYFVRNNNTDLAARGTQIKDYFGLTSPDLEITEDMLRYAALNYVKDTGINNEMTLFFNGIVDWKKAAKWLSEMSTVYTGANILNKLKYGSK